MNPDLVTYRPRQAAEHVIPLLHRPPAWLIDCGPGSAEEHLDFRVAFPGIDLLGLEPAPVGYAKARARWPADAYLFPVAAWDADGEVTLHQAGTILHGSCFADFGRALADDAGGESPEMITVPARSLDSLDRDVGPFHDAFLWLDVEGAELRVLRGAADLLARGAVMGVNVETRPETEAELAAILGAAGFVLARRYLACRTYWDAVWLLGAK